MNTKWYQYLDAIPPDPRGHASPRHPGPGRHRSPSFVYLLEHGAAVFVIPADPRGHAAPRHPGPGRHRPAAAGRGPGLRGGARGAAGGGQRHDGARSHAGGQVGVGVIEEVGWGTDGTRSARLLLKHIRGLAVQLTRVRLLCCTGLRTGARGAAGGGQRHDGAGAHAGGQVGLGAM